MRSTSPATPAVSRSIAIQATDLVKSFVTGQETVRAVRGISLDVHRGEVVTLEGPSGSGKTTLLCILGCMLTPDSGRLVIDGREVDPRRPDRLPEFRRTSIGFVFQQFNLFPALTARENILYALKIKGVTGKKARLETSRMIEAVGLKSRERARPRELSGGQKQRVAIARALAGPASILLADEPTANLDAQTGLQILDVFRELARLENRAVVIVTHDPKVRRIADRVCTIHDGLLTELDSDHFQEPPPEGPRPARSLGPAFGNGNGHGNGSNGDHLSFPPPSAPAPRRYPTTLAFGNRRFHGHGFEAIPEPSVNSTPLPSLAISDEGHPAVAVAPKTAIPEESRPSAVALSTVDEPPRPVDQACLAPDSGPCNGLDVDTFHFAGRFHEGDGEVSSWVDVPAGASAGVMWRADPGPDAPYVGLVITHGRGVSLLWRASAGGPSFEMTDHACRGRTHLKLARRGDSFTGYVSNDDRVESTVGFTTVALRSRLFLGFAVSRDADLKPVRVTFEGSSVA